MDASPTPQYAELVDLPKLQELMESFSQVLGTANAVLGPDGEIIARAGWVADEAEFEAIVERALVEDGPWLIGVRTDDAAPEGVTDRDPVRIRERFMQGMGVRR